LRWGRAGDGEKGPEFEDVANGCSVDQAGPFAVARISMIKVSTA
jgi:hypothetical protein